MSLFESLGNQQQQMTPQQAVQQLRADPSGMLRQFGMNVPANMKDPQQIVNHLLQSGQVPQARYQQALRMMGRR